MWASTGNRGAQNISKTYTITFVDTCLHPTRINNNESGLLAERTNDKKASLVTNSLLSCINCCTTVGALQKAVIVSQGFPIKEPLAPRGLNPVEFADWFEVTLSHTHPATTVCHTVAATHYTYLCKNNELH